jgi:hypothetical protein
VYTITVWREGYERKSEKLHTASGQSYNLDITLPVKQGPIRDVLPTLLPGAPGRETKADLTVNVTPRDAQVRLVGVKRSYEPGIQLDLGKYQIEVSKAGYESERKWIVLSEPKPVELSVELRQKTANMKKPPQKLSAGPENRSNLERIEDLAENYKKQKEMNEEMKKLMELVDKYEREKKGGIIRNKGAQ